MRRPRAPELHGEFLQSRDGQVWYIEYTNDADLSAQLYNISKKYLHK